MIGIIYPIHKCFNELIFDKDYLLDFRDNRTKTGKIIRFRKSFEFRTRLPKELTTGTKIYVYETSKNGGCQKVVGEFTVGQILACNYPIGAYPFLPYFCRNILGNEEYAQKFEDALKTEMPHFKKGTAVNFALDEASMKFIKETGDYPDFYVQNRERYNNAEKVIKQCDEWLMAMGFYNEFCESCYKYAYEILNPIRYDTPKPLTDFSKLDGEVITKAPQSFVYVNEV